jgi:hypothetical protein
VSSPAYPAGRADCCSPAWSSIATARYPGTRWPKPSGSNPDPAAIDTRLNPLLSKLRRVFGPESVEVRSALRFCLPDVWVDLEAAVDAIHRAESAVAQE